jgi:hypothetical protein
VDFEGAGDHFMRASLTHAVHDAAALAQVTDRDNGECDIASRASAPASADITKRGAKIVRMGHAALPAGSIAHPGTDYENGVRLTIQATPASDAGQACHKRAPQTRAILTKIISVRPDPIGSGGTGAAGVPYARQTAARAGRAQIPDGDGVYSARVGTQAKAAARRLIRSQAAVALRGANPEARLGRQHRAAAHVHTPVQIDAPFTYDALYVIVEAKKRANSIDAPKVLAAMPVTGYTGVAGQIAFDDKGGLKEGAIARRDIAGGGNAVLRRHGHAMTGVTLGGTDLSDGAVFASASGGFASIPIEADRFRAVNP